MRSASFLLIAALALVAVVYIDHKPVKVINHTVYRTRTITRTVREPVTLHHESDPEPGTMTVREFQSIHNRMTGTYIKRMFGDSYANRANDHQDVFPAEGGGWFVIYYDHKHDNFVVGKDWHP